jgi:hypothetical protein
MKIANKKVKKPLTSLAELDHALLLLPLHRFSVGISVFYSLIQIQAKLEFEGRRMKNPTRSTLQILSVCPSRLGWLSPPRCLGGFGSKFLEAGRIYGNRFLSKKTRKKTIIEKKLLVFLHFFRIFFPCCLQKYRSQRLSGWKL